MGDDVLAPEGLEVREPDALRQVMVESEPDVVYHLAAEPLASASWARPARTFEVNATGTLHVVDAALACVDAPRVLVVSASDVYGAVPVDDQPVREERAVAPISPLAASKAAAEVVALQAWYGTHLPVVIARPFNHVGPDQPTEMVVPAIVQRMLDAERAGRRSVPVANAAARRDYTDVRDIVRAYRSLAVAGAPGTTYNVCSGKDVSVGELAALLAEQVGIEVEESSDASPARRPDIAHLCGDPARVREATGWVPEISLRQMLSDVVQWRRARS